MSSWITPVVVPPLASGEVHVWRLSVRELMPLAARLRPLLDAGEGERERRFYFEADSARHLMSHGVLRVLLAHYTGHSPTDIQYETGAHGKPSLVPAGGATVQFNLSHSGDVVLIAVAENRSLGVDVEKMALRSPAELNSVASYAFAPAEQQRLREMSAADYARAFYAIWSRKEAYIKATGAGISKGLDYFEVTSDAGDARLLVDHTDSRAVARWRLAELDVRPGYSGALACESFGALYRWRCNLELASALLSHPWY